MTVPYFNWRNGMTFREAVDMGTQQLTQENSILKEADDLVTTARQAVYGHPFDDYSRTAKLWSAVLGAEVTPEQAALCMIMVKISRLVNSPDHRDSQVDVAGYIKVYNMIRERRNG